MPNPPQAPVMRLGMRMVRVSRYLTAGVWIMVLVAWVLEEYMIF